MRSLQNSIILLGVLSVLLAGAWQFYRDPRLQGLFHPEPTKTPQSLKAPTRPVPPPARAAPPGPARAASPRTDPSALSRPTTQPPARRSPNDVVSRVLLQALGGRKIAAGVSLEVTDSTILVAGEVDSDATRRQIISLVERASEGRSVDSIGLVVTPPRDRP